MYSLVPTSIVSRVKQQISTTTSVPNKNKENIIRCYIDGKVVYEPDRPRDPFRDSQTTMIYQGIRE